MSFHGRVEIIWPEDERRPVGPLRFSPVEYRGLPALDVWAGDDRLAGVFLPSGGPSISAWRPGRRPLPHKVCGASRSLPVSIRQEPGGSFENAKS
jgi:hypothetical protein